MFKRNLNETVKCRLRNKAYANRTQNRTSVCRYLIRFMFFETNRQVEVRINQCFFLGTQFSFVLNKVTNRLYFALKDLLMNIEDTHVCVKNETFGNLNRFTQTQSNCQYSGPQIRSSSFRSKMFSLDFDTFCDKCMSLTLLPWLTGTGDFLSRG